MEPHDSKSDLPLVTSTVLITAVLGTVSICIVPKIPWTDQLKTLCLSRTLMTFLDLS